MIKNTIQMGDPYITSKIYHYKKQLPTKIITKRNILPYITSQFLENKNKCKL